MNILYLIKFLLYCVLIQGQQCNGTHVNVSEAKSAKASLSYADFLENALNKGSWSNEDQPCLGRLYKIIEDSRNNTLYAVWMLDSMQVIPNGQLYGSGLHLTNYDECLEHHWRATHPDLNTQYCLAKVRLGESKKHKGYVPHPEDSTDLYLKTRTPEDLDLTIMNWGLCLPDICPQTTAGKIFRVLLQSSHLGLMADEATINIDSCKIAGTDHRNYEPEAKLRYLMLTLLALAVWSTYYTTNHKLNPKSYVHEIIRSFCLKRNLDTLTSVHDDDEIYVLNSMRIISSILVVIGHCIIVMMTRMTVRGLIVEKMFAESGTMERNGNYVVDTFFTLSGMLLVRSYLKGNWSNPIKFLIKRYMRLFGLLGVLVYVKTYVLYNLGDGPLWEQTIGVEQKICQAHAWNTFATLNNYLGMDKLCYLVSWSTSVDYHMTIVAVILCTIYGRNRRHGIVMYIVIFLASLVIPCYVMYIDKLPVVLIYGFESIDNLRDNIVFQTMYRYTHTRAGPFLVGMAMGYVIATFRPKEYRKRISRVASYIYVVACLATMHLLVVLGGDYYYRNPEATGVAIFGGIHRTVHAAVICAIIAIAEYGDLGILNEFFKWSPLISLGRLTYGVYLVHYIIIERHTRFIRTGLTSDTVGTAVVSMGIAVISFVLSFILSLLVEGPVVNVVNVLLEGPRGLKNKGKTNLDAPVSNGHTTNSNGHITNCNDHVTNSNDHITNSNGHIKTYPNGIKNCIKKDK